MPNSDSTNTRRGIVLRAYRGLGIPRPSVTQVSQAVSLLNDIVKEIDVEGKFLWAIDNTPTTLTLVSSTRSYAVGTAPTGIASNILELAEVEIVQGTTRIPLIIIGKEESISTTLREGTGQPTLVYLENRPAMANNKIHFFQTPDAAYSVEYTYRRRLYDFDNASDTPDFPQDWAQRLVKRLRYELAPEFGIPLEERMVLKSESDEAMKAGKQAASEVKDPVTQKTVFF